WVLHRSSEANSSAWSIEPLWLHGAQVNLPADQAAQEDLYKPGALKWVFTQIRQVTRAPVLVLFKRRAITESSWTLGQSNLAPAPLDDSMLVTVVELEENAE
ncbi:MAG TPA: hypothetical protein VL860_14520, partial [Planctomycetota bacterium]|nr:hypothetical protein [Planctomycetota bacterium]